MGSMRRRLTAVCAVLLSLAAGAGAAASDKGNPFAAPPRVDVAEWHLVLAGSGLALPARLGYAEVSALPRVRVREQLVCPGLFGYFAEWEGPSLALLLDSAKVKSDYAKVTFTAIDGYSVSYTREEVESHLLVCAVAKDGKVLPPAEGFPLRLVAGGFSGGHWVRWIREIRVE
jgi:DMSO/TMAO reductase YedYZ molybdopterin-dependent catalytic subunit